MWPEDGAAALAIEYEPYDPVPDAQAAVAAGAALLHDQVAGNVAADFTVRVGDADAVFRTAEVVTRERYYVQRYTGMPLETRGVAADYDLGTGGSRLDLHAVAAYCPRRPARRARARRAPDPRDRSRRGRRLRREAGDLRRGGPGPPAGDAPGLAREVDRDPARARDHAAAHAREQWHDIELAARRDGTILAMRAELLADMGAYTRSLGVLCPSITAASLPGPYRIKHYTCRVRAALTCKAPGRVSRGRPARGGLRHRARGRTIWRVSSAWTRPSSAA